MQYILLTSAGLASVQRVEKNVLSTHLALQLNPINIFIFSSNEFAEFSRVNFRLFIEIARAFASLYRNEFDWDHWTESFWYDTLKLRF